MTSNQLLPQEGHNSPWGVIETAELLADGIVSVQTPSHGGIWLSKARLAQMPPDQRSTDGWYEEDCEAAFPLKRFREEMLQACPADRLDHHIDAVMTWSGGSFARIAMNRRP